MKLCALCHTTMEEGIYGPYCSWKCGDLFDATAPAELISKVYKEAREYDEIQFTNEEK